MHVSDDIGRFQNIIDIAPIALPTGTLLTLTKMRNRKLNWSVGVYPHFDNYVSGLLNLWLPLPGKAGSRPLVGSAARRETGSRLCTMSILQPLELGW